MMWARVKGKTENDLMKLPFKAEYNFRPGVMLPFRRAEKLEVHLQDPCENIQNCFTKKCIDHAGSRTGNDQCCNNWLP